nr:NUDIX domain-containing protein [Prevotella sp.]
MTGFYGEHSKVWVSVDCIVLGFEEDKLKLLVGKRQMDPGRGQWSLYGGFVEPEESLGDAANRVLYELSGLKKIYMKQVGAYGAIDRDPGERVISIAYCALINVKDYDDELRKQHNLEWVNLKDMPHLYSDHNRMVHDTIMMLRRHINTEPLSFNLLPELFTLTQLQHVYEALLDGEIDKRNFRKRIKQIDFIEKTDEIDKVTSKRGAALYRFNERIYDEDPSFKL